MAKTKKVEQQKVESKASKVQKPKQKPKVVTGSLFFISQAASVKKKNRHDSSIQKVCGVVAS